MIALIMNIVTGRAIAILGILIVCSKSRLPFTLTVYLQPSSYQLPTTN